MQPYEDPHTHYDKYMQRSAAKYVDGLRKAGLKPNDKLTRALAERTFNEAREDYRRRETATRDHNIQVILRNHKKEMNEIKRKGARLRLVMCPPIAALFGLLAWYNFHSTGDPAKALAAYNCGSGCLAHAVALGGVGWEQWLPEQTRHYITGIL